MERYSGQPQVIDYEMLAKTLSTKNTNQRSFAFAQVDKPQSVHTITSYI